MQQFATIIFGITLALVGIVGGRSAVAEPIKLGSGYGNYCSKTWPDGGSAFSFVPDGGDPCAWMDPAATGTIRRKGVYANSSWNNVILRCDQGVWFWTAVGDAPLESAYTEAYETPPAKSNCVFTVAPRTMRIFSTPFFFPGIKPGNGFDFARNPYISLDLTQYGTGTATAATVVNHKGQDMTGRPGNIDDHTGHDWGLNVGTPLHAVGDGVVIRAGQYYKAQPAVPPIPPIPAVPPSPGVPGVPGVPGKPGVPACFELEADVYIKHTVCGKNNYCEQFVSYYTHMDEVVVFKGQSVKRGAFIGTSGDSGCVPAHLHFTISKLSNTTHKLLETLTFTDQGSAIVFGKVLKGKDGKIIKKNVSSDVYNWGIDPFGWDAPFIDPWALQAFGSGNGAMSIYLWRTGQAPPVGDW